MAVSLELRAPILDHKLMEMVALIPSHLKLHGDTGKYIFKKSFESILPANILYRRKQGFAIPLDQWFRRELKDVAYEAIMNHDDGILDRKYLAKIWKQHQAGSSLMLRISLVCVDVSQMAGDLPDNGDCMSGICGICEPGAQIRPGRDGAHAECLLA